MCIIIFFFFFCVWSLGCLNVFALSCFFSFVLHLMRRNRAGDRRNAHLLKENMEVRLEEFCFKAFDTFHSYFIVYQIHQIRIIESVGDHFGNTTLPTVRHETPQPLTSSVCHGLTSEVLRLSAYVSSRLRLVFLKGYTADFYILAPFPTNHKLYFTENHFVNRAAVFSQA